MVEHPEQEAPRAQLASEHEREQRLLAEARVGSAGALATLESSYRPMVVGYLTCLTGNPEAARPLARDVLSRMEQQLNGHAATSSLPAWLLLGATDVGLAYLRHVRALQLAGVSRAPRAPISPVPPRSGPTTWLRTVWERFRPSSDADRRVDRTDRSQPAPHGAPERGAQTGSRRGEVSATRRVRRDERRAVGWPPEPREVLRRRILRAVLADLGHEEARCLALHLVAGLSHAEVAYISSLTPQDARAAIIEGLQLFAVRYDEALELLGISPSVFDDRAGEQPALAPSTVYARPQTLELRAAAAPTHHISRGSSPRALPITTPRHATRTFPMRSASRADPATPARMTASSAADAAAAPAPASVAVLSPQPRSSNAEYAGYTGGDTLHRQDAMPPHRASGLPRRPSPQLSSASVPVLSGDGSVPRIPVRSPDSARF